MDANEPRPSLPQSRSFNGSSSASADRQISGEKIEVVRHICEKKAMELVNEIRQVTGLEARQVVEYVKGEASKATGQSSAR